MYFEGRASRIPDSFFLQGLAGSKIEIQRRPSEVPHSWSEGGVEDGAGVSGRSPGLGQSGRKASAAEGHKTAPGQLGIDLINGFFPLPLNSPMMAF